MVIQVDGHGHFAPLAQAVGLPVRRGHQNHWDCRLVACWGIILQHCGRKRSIYDRGLVGIACTAYMPMVALAGHYGTIRTNPISFAWPRPGYEPLVYDMATAAMAMGDVQIAARDGRTVPLGTGLDAAGNMTTDPAAIAKGVLLPFGGYKGSAIALMVELLAAGLTGEQFSFEARATDNGDGGPPRGGEMILSLAPSVIAGEGWEAHVEGFVEKLQALDGIRLPGARRHYNRLDTGPRAINAALVDTIKDLL